MKTVHPLCAYTFANTKNSLLPKHYRNRLPIHCSAERAIEMAKDIKNGRFSMRELTDKNVRDMAHVLMAFVQQREAL